MRQPADQVSDISYSHVTFFPQVKCTSIPQRHGGVQSQTTTNKVTHAFSVFPVHIKVPFILHCSLLNEQLHCLNKINTYLGFENISKKCQPLYESSVSYH